MRSTQTCPKCSGRKFAVTDEYRLPDREYDGMTQPMPAVSLDSEGLPKRGASFGGVATGRLESWLCLGCGYVEFYAKDYDLSVLEQLQRKCPGRFRIVDAGRPEGAGRGEVGEEVSRRRGQRKACCTVHTSPVGVT
jgi:hypothetical protein